ncbi:DUF4255 domain-containing protein [Chryseobacterium formosus]|uniref:DUF4255 domain-containing protein n=1 Tax=Chryseobacterium formosus TaxID=1537363 RepID=A0ABT3XUG4_9FLAO|nr:DUF4255 domain-containing protein [Chryseobacterium formosus]MCX8525303.1 DUF4255 domain-containing protein [Chryseobacterium formosus]
MIDKVLTVLKNKLNSQDGLWDPNVPDDVDIATVNNIAKNDEEDASGINDKVVITLLNVEEESIMKNASRYTPVKVGNTVTGYELESPPAYLNLYVMIAANRSSYDRALINISKTIEVFQVNNTLTYVDSTPSKSFSFRIELHTIPFEQLSYVWGLLGGKIMPSAFYKISVIKIAPNLPAKDIELIDKVNIKSFKVD